jgi:CheY-like chemotaxis protein
MNKKLKNILLIEDDPITNFINQRLIKKVNPSLQVTIAHNGLEGLSYIKECKAKNQCIPQLIFLDINMPVMDGFEFLQEFQNLKLKEKTVIVMLTTSTHLKDLDKLFQSGNSDIIAKPFSEEKFIAILDKYFDDNQYSQTG